MTSKTKTVRPQYQTSKEQYDLMTKALRHFIPDISLEKDQLREVVARLSNETRAESSTPSPGQSSRRNPNQANSFPDRPQISQESKQRDVGERERLVLVESHHIYTNVTENLGGPTTAVVKRKMISMIPAAEAFKPPKDNPSRLILLPPILAIDQIQLHDSARGKHHAKKSLLPYAPFHRLSKSEFHQNSQLMKEHHMRV